MKKSTKILVAVNVIIALVVVIAAFKVRSSRQQRDTIETERQFALALSQLTQSTAGPQRVEVFVQSLKAINPGHASTEVKAALQDYIHAWEQSVAAVKAGKSPTSNDAAIAAANDHLLSTFRKFGRPAAPPLETSATNR